MPSHARLHLTVVVTFVLTLLTGCQSATHRAGLHASTQTSPSLQDFAANGSTSQQGNATGPQKGGHVIGAQPVIGGLVRVLDVKLIRDGYVELVVRQVAKNAAGENVVDLDSPTGLLNFITATYPHRQIHRIIIHSAEGNEAQPVYITGKNGVSQSVNASAATFALGQHIQVPPPGATIDHTATPLAKPDASPDQKADAILRTAAQLEDTKYVWGESRDKGQSAFDCASFAAFVYHRALGYQMSSLSRVQWDSVGIGVPIWDRRKGDLLIFENGKHVGIYAGDDKMIQAGGGLGKVGYVSIGPESYWGKRLNSVRRMY